MQLVNLQCLCRLVGRLVTVMNCVEAAGCHKAVFVWDGLSPSAKCACDIHVYALHLLQHASLQLHPDNIARRFEMLLCIMSAAARCLLADG